MNTKLYWIHASANHGRLGIMPKPRGGEWLRDEIINLKNQRADILISLLENPEINELDLAKEELLCHESGMDFINFPIADRGLPASNLKVNELVNLINENLLSGLSIIIHCRMGIGRSSIIAGAVLLKQGYNANSAIEKISKVRGLRVPDTVEQLNWLKNRGSK